MRTIMTENAQATTTTLPKDTVCWIVTNGMAGYEMQALGVAAALGVDPVVKRVTPGAPYSWVSPWGPAAPDPQITAPWPDVVIAGGRQAIPYARAIKKRSGGRTLVVVFQDPKVNPATFDLVWAPVHDQLKGANVITTLTAPHRITEEKLKSASTDLASRYGHLTGRNIAVVIGGTNKVYDLSAEKMQGLAAKLRDMALREKVNLIITTSRRTCPQATKVLRETLKDVPHDLYDALSDPAEDNPYPGLLGLCETTIVTCDSHNMVGEATMTGRTVYVVELEGGSPKFRRFIDALYVNGVARQFDGLLETWSYAPLNATQEIAAAIAQAYGQKRAALSN